MGIKNLFKFLESYPDLVKKVHISKYKNKKVAIDISILVYQIVISIRNSGTDFVNKKGELVSHILGIFNKTISFLEQNILPIYVFDGKPPEIKHKLLKSRKVSKQKAFEKMEKATNNKEKIKYFKRCVTITRKHMENCKKLLDLMGIPYINAPEEADSQCAFLAKNGLVDAVATEDMDILTFGSPCILRNFSVKKKYILELNIDDILKKLSISKEQFINLCIFFGCDYCPKIYGLTKTELLNYTKTISVDVFLEKMKKLNNKLSYDNYLKVFDYFTNPKITNVNKTDLILKKPKFNELLNFLVNDNGFSKYKIKKKLDKLSNTYKKIYVTKKSLIV